MGLWDWTRKEPKWSFVIDTKDYAGNFDRELAGYVTGRWDYDGGAKGEKHAKMFKADFPEDPFKRLISFRVDDHGDDAIVRSPMALAPTPGWGNDNGEAHQIAFAPKHIQRKLKYPAYLSVAIFLQRRPTPAELDILVKRAKAFPFKYTDHAGGTITVTGCRLVSERLVLESIPVG